MHSCGPAKLILLAAYFLIKYPNAQKLLHREERQNGILAGVKRRKHAARWTQRIFL